MSEGTGIVKFWFVDSDAKLLLEAAKQFHSDDEKITKQMEVIIKSIETATYCQLELNPRLREQARNPVIRFNDGKTAKMEDGKIVFN